MFFFLFFIFSFLSLINYIDPSKLISVRSCKKGDIVLLPKIGTLRIDFEGEEYYIVQDKEILAVVEQE